jgi:vitamin K-dependent gamma-carboxylase
MSTRSQQSAVSPEAAIPYAQEGARWSPLAWAATARDALAARLLAPVDNASIVTFRVFFGLLMFWEIYRYFQYGWIDAIYTDPPFLFTYYGFGWVHPLPVTGMHLLFFALGMLALCVMAGLWYRIVMPLFALGFTYVFLLEKAHFLNHLYLACLISFLMIFVPAHRAFSVDVWRKPSLRSDTAPTWALVLLASQVGIAYFYGGLAKINWDWLRGEPMRTWMARDTDFPVIGRWFTDEWFVYFISYSGLLFDLLIVPALLWRRTRWFAVAALILFHRFNAEMFSIGIFPMFGTLSVILFLPPDLPRKVVNGLVGKPGRRSARKGKPGQATAPGAPATVVRFTDRPTMERLTLILVAAWIVIQLIVPFRHWLYTGNTAWTDQGDRFAWRMMLVSKSGTVTFEIRDPATGQTWEVDPADYLSGAQHSAMVSQPDMILQFSHYLADQWRQDGYENVEVRAISSISLNGRENYYPLVDPTVNLAAEELTPFNASWITSIEDLERDAATQPAHDGEG